MAAPTAIAIDGVEIAGTDPQVTIPENTQSGFRLGTLTAIDSDADDTATFTVVDDAGGRFFIRNGELRVTEGAVLDFEHDGGYAVTIRATDASGVTLDRVLQIGLTDYVYQQDRELDGEGVDTIRTSIDYVLAPDVFVESLRAISSIGVALTGGMRDDRLYGNDAANVLRGAGGDDTIDGGAGGDRLVGSVGADVLTGGAGDDTFVYEALTDSGIGVTLRDRILDFTAHDGATLHDRIDLSAIDALAGGGDNAFTFVGTAAFRNAGDLRAVIAGTTTLVSGDVNGDRVADFQIVLNGAPALNATDFVL